MIDKILNRIVKIVVTRKAVNILKWLIIFSNFMYINVNAVIIQNEMGKYHYYKDYNNPRIKKILDYGKNPGLGIRKLHDAGYTGKGISIAYIDQPVLTMHEQFRNMKLHYFKIGDKNDPWMKQPSFHGTSVLSILVGKDTGITTSSDVYYVANPSWKLDYSIIANGIRKIIEINKTLSKGKKIRIVGISITDEMSYKNINDFWNTIKEAENNDIMVITCNHPFDINVIGVEYPSDKDNSKNYTCFGSYSNINPFDSFINVPANGITTAAANSNIDYTYWEYDGGLSWTPPYIEGVIALGFQINPNLTMTEAINDLNFSSSLSGDGHKIINPEGFLALVKQNMNIFKNGYYYLINNKNIDISKMLMHDSKIRLVNPMQLAD